MYKPIDETLEKLFFGRAAAAAQQKNAGDAETENVVGCFMFLYF